MISIDDDVYDYEHLYIIIYPRSNLSAGLAVSRRKITYPYWD